MKLRTNAHRGYAFGASDVPSATGEVPERGSVPLKYKWDLEAVYSSIEEWERVFSSLSLKLDSLASFKGRLGESSTVLLEFLGQEEEIAKELGKLYVYANMKSHEDLRVTRHQELADKAENLMMRHGTVVSFFSPEILSMPEGMLERFLDENKGLGLYRFHFEELLRERAHVLSHNEEELLAQTHELGSLAQAAFSMLTDADMRFPLIRDENGQEVELTEERYYKLSRSTDRSVRQAAFEGIHGTYEKYKNAIGTLYAGSVKGDIFYSRTRKYKNCLEKALFADNVPESVYDNVVKNATHHAPLLHTYMDLRKKALQLDELHFYDLNVPLSEEPVSEISYEDALELVVEALAPLGEDYVGNLRRAFAERWIDVYENQGKRKGAYSWGSYGTRPYVLLNYNGTLRDVFTLAHEMGHSLHSWYSHSTQPQVYADYTILLAEVASTTNEALLLEHLLRKSRTESEKKWLLTYSFDMVRTTFFRQAMFAEYEQTTHRYAEGGEVLTPAWLSQLWKDLNTKYYGPSMTIDKAICMEWARIPHFYTAFYVYKYVTGFTAAGAFAQAILNEEKSATERYLAFLKSGSSDYSLEILKKAGVDLTSPKPYEETLTAFRNKLEEGKALF